MREVVRRTKGPDGRGPFGKGDRTRQPFGPDRRRRYGPPNCGIKAKLGGEFDACPTFDQLTIAPSGSVGGKCSRISIVADPYVAGPWAEGAYEVELAIPKALVALVAPAYRASFPG